MNKIELIKKLSSTSGVAQKNTKEVLNAMINVIKDTLIKGEEVKITGFGKFEVKERAQRVTINPRTQKKMIIPKSKVASFRVGKELKTAVNV